MSEPLATALESDYVSHLNALVIILQREQDALKERNFDDVVNCTQEKEALFNKIAALETQRFELEKNAQGPEHYSFRRSFKNKTEQLIRKCNDLNILNGSLIEISRQFNHRLLSIILGGSLAGEETYNAEGASTENKLKHVVAEI